LAATFAIGGVLVVAAAAWACTPLASIDLDDGDKGAAEPSSEDDGGTATAQTGEVVEGSGRGFTPGQAVEVHFNGKNGPLLWEGVPRTGEFSFSFEAPNVAPGYYVVMAYNDTNAGDPARVVLRVVSPAQPNGQTNDPGAERQSDAPAQSSASGSDQQARSRGSGPAAAPQGSSTVARTEGAVSEATSSKGRPARAGSGARRDPATARTDRARPVQVAPQADPSRRTVVAAPGSDTRVWIGVGLTAAGVLFTLIAAAALLAGEDKRARLKAAVVQLTPRRPRR